MAQILVVEDETLQRALLNEVVRAEGHLVIGAASAEEAVELLERTTVDVAVVDVHLPGLSGVELLRTIREVSPRTEVVIVTSRPSVDVAVSCLRAGAFDFLVKPVESSVLATSVSRALEQGRLQWRAAIYEVSQQLSSGQDPEQIPEMVVRAAREALEADEASLLLPKSDGTLAIAAATGLDPSVFAGVRLALGERVAGRVAQDRQPALLPERLADDPRFTDVASHGRVASSIVYPLISQETLRGVLTLGRHAGSRSFRPTDLEWTALLARAITSALDNADLIRRLVTSERLAVMGQLTAALGHEVNNTLAFVVSNLAFIEESLEEMSAGGSETGTCPDSLQETVSAAREASDGGRLLRQIIADMRTLARPDDGVETHVDLRVPLEAAVRLAAARRMAHLEIDIAEDVEVLGRSGLLTQVFLNLLVNAEQAMTQAGVTDRRVRIHCRRDGEWAVIEIGDNGPGVPRELQRRIFEPFFTTKPVGEGTGMGLSLCRDIVSRHGGRIELAEGVELGATFVVTLPAAVDSGERAAG